VLESEDIGQIPLSGIGTSQLAQALHAELPELFGRGMSKHFHDFARRGTTTLGKCVVIANPVELHVNPPGKSEKLAKPQ
jgi:hypothetical protein